MFLCYEKRYADILTSEWIARKKESLRKLAGMFSMGRMVKEYMLSMYEPAILNGINEHNGKAKEE